MKTVKYPTFLRGISASSSCTGRHAKSIIVQPSLLAWPSKKFNWILRKNSTYPKTFVCVLYTHNNNTTYPPWATSAACGCLPPIPAHGACSLHYEWCSVRFFFVSRGEVSSVAFLLCALNWFFPNTDDVHRHLCRCPSLSATGCFGWQNATHHKIERGLGPRL